MCLSSNQRNSRVVYNILFLEVKGRVLGIPNLAPERNVFRFSMLLASVISINTDITVRILKISKFWLLRQYLERNNVIFLAMIT